MTTTNTADLLAALTSTAAAVRDRGWASPGLTGGQNTNATNATTNGDPLSGLGSAGLGWFTPFVSFLAQPSQVVQSNQGTVSTGSTGFGQGGQAVSGVANQYQQAASSETKGWSGDAASAYQGTSSQILDSINSLAEAAYSMSDAIAGAGEVVGQASAIISQLGGEAVGQIVPIMSQAVAAAPVTGGASIAAAIPQCVGIATNYAQQMLAKLGELLSSGQNLLKLVKGGLAVVQLVTKALKAIGDQSSGGGSSQSSQSGDTTQQSGTQQQVDTPTASDASDSTDTDSADDASSADTGSVSDIPTTSESQAGDSQTSGPLTGAGDNETTSPAAAIPRATTSASSSMPGGYGMAPMGAGVGASRDTESASRRTPGALTGAFEDEQKELTAGREAGAAKGSGAQRGGMGMAGMGGRGAQRQEDKEHQRRIQHVETDEAFDGADEDVVLARPVIGEVV